jgi:hypothetical protein
MKQFYADPQDIETSSRDIGDRLTELTNQRWERSKSLALAVNEGMDFNDRHWEVIVFLRNYYQEHGLPLGRGQPPGRSIKTFPARVATSTCTGFSTTARLRKAAGSPICPPLHPPPTVRSAPITEPAGF